MENEWHVGQNFTDHFALHSDAASVNDSDGCEASPMYLFQIGFNSGFDVARREGVKIQYVSDRDLDWVLEVFHSNREFWSLGPYRVSARWCGRPARGFGWEVRLQS